MSDQPLDQPDDQRQEQQQLERAGDEPGDPERALQARSGGTDRAPSADRGCPSRTAGPARRRISRPIFGFQTIAASAATIDRDADGGHADAQQRLRQHDRRHGGDGRRPDDAPALVRLVKGGRDAATAGRTPAGPGPRPDRAIAATSAPKPSPPAPLSLARERGRRLDGSPPLASEGETDGGQAPVLRLRFPTTRVLPSPAAGRGVGGEGHPRKCTMLWWPVKSASRRTRSRPS